MKTSNIAKSKENKSKKTDTEYRQCTAGVFVNEVILANL